ncbi:MAG: B-box zinc finger protein [Armatimonadetes bacterium]|nr:B-box zinc finger protein [Armatimonadota bacterium]
MQCQTHEDRKTEVVCKECGKPICEECAVKLSDNPYCPLCVEKAKVTVTQAVDAMAGNVNWGRAALFGAIVAGIGAALWYAVGVWFNLQIGLVAIAIGWGVANAVILGSGGKRGIGLQILSLLLTAAGIFGGLIVSLHHDLLQEIAKGTLQYPADQAWLISVLALPFALKEMGIITWAIIGFGLYEGFVLPAMPKLKLDV